MTIAASHSMYFLAILCPEALNEQVLAFKHRMRDLYGCRIALKSPAHITVVPPFWWPELAELQLVNTLQDIQSPGVAPFLKVDGFSHFGKKVLFAKVLSDPLLDQLRINVLSRFNEKFPDIIKPDGRPFHPHITIANRDLKPHDFDGAWLYFSKKRFIAEFAAERITLLKLHAGHWIPFSERFIGE
jgi:2'-5' RNA ligase